MYMYWTPWFYLPCLLAFPFFLFNSVDIVDSFLRSVFQTTNSLSSNLLFNTSIAFLGSLLYSQLLDILDSALGSLSPWNTRVLSQVLCSQAEAGVRRIGQLFWAGLGLPRNGHLAEDGRRKSAQGQCKCVVGDIWLEIGCL